MSLNIWLHRWSKREGGGAIKYIILAEEPSVAREKKFKKQNI